MEECGSEGLDNLLFSKKDTFLNDVDYICISDNYWLGTQKPCLTYGLRGICPFSVEVSCSNKDLHSGLYGGTMLVLFLIFREYFQRYRTCSQFSEMKL